MHTFLQIAALLMSLIASFFLIKGMVGISAKDIVNLSKTPYGGYTKSVAKNLARRRADTRVGFALILLSFFLQSMNYLRPMRYDDFGINKIGFTIAILFSAILFLAAYGISSFMGRKCISKINVISKGNVTINNKDTRTMNWKRGFRRIAFVLAVFIAFGAACLSVLFILGEHSNAKSKLTAKRYDYYDKYGYVGFYETEHGLTSFVPDNPTKSQMNIYKTRLEKKYKELSDKSPVRTDELFEQMPAISTLLDLENGFWVNLPKSGLIGLCIAGGLVGGTIGFVIVCLIYKLLEWLVLGFCDNPADEQKQ